MDISTICEVISWITKHPEHVYDEDDDFVDNKPSEKWFRFLQNPGAISEYSDPINHNMDGDEVDIGCDYVFERGSYRSCRCDIEVLPGKTRCAFHDHVIFSKELRGYIKDQHKWITDAYTHGIDVTTNVPQGTMEISVESADEGLFRETTHNLALGCNSTGQPVCVGYFRNPELPMTRNNIFPLTLELQGWCQSRNIPVASL